MTLGRLLSHLAVGILGALYTALPAVGADKLIVYGGSIQTVDASQATAEAVLIEGGKIKELGTYSELSGHAPNATELNLHGRTMMPGFIGQGLGGYLLTRAIIYGGRRKVPLILDTCTLDHPGALENYQKRGFVIYDQQDEEYPDPRLDGTIRRDAGQHVPLAES